MQKKTDQKSNSIDATWVADDQPPSGDCLDRETLLRIIDDTHPVNSQTEQHLQSCTYCQRNLNSVSDMASMEIYQAPARRLGGDITQLEPALAEGDIGSIAGIPIESVVGRGGMGVVYLGRDEKLKRKVAIKILAHGRGDLSRQRFERETQALSKLEHPNIVSVYAAGESRDGRPWLAMPYVEGESLKQRISANGLEHGQAAEIVLQVSKGLAAAHAANLLHRDIKPANILMDDKNGLAKLADFGLVRVENEKTLTVNDFLCGTPEYISPEQANTPDQMDSRSDIYSLGITLYECLTGITPFRGKPLSILDQHKDVEPIPPQKLNPAIPLDLQNVCLKAIEKNPEHRYASASEFGDDLQRFLDGIPVRARSVGALQRLFKWSLRNRALSSAILASLLLLSVLAIGSTIASLKLRQSNNRLLEQTNKATTAEEKANRNRDLAVGTLNNLVDTVFEDLTNNSASIKTRESLANAVIDGLASFVDNTSNSNNDQTLCLAYTRIAELSSLKGESESAIRYFDLAIEICDEQINASTDNQDFKRFKAIATAKLAQHHFRITHPQTLETTLNAARQLSELNPIEDQNPELSGMLLSMQIQELELHRLQYPLNRKTLIDKGYILQDDYDWLVDSSQIKIMALESMAKLAFLIGRAELESLKPTEARIQFVKATGLIDRVLDANPGNLQLQTQQAVFTRALGMAEGQLGNTESASRQLGNALRKMEAIESIAPADLSAKLNTANTRSIYAQSFASLGEYSQMRNEFIEAIVSYRQLIDLDPENLSTPMLAIDAYTRLWNAELANGQLEDAAKSLASVDEILNSLPESAAEIGTVRLYSMVIPNYREATEILLGESPAAPSVTAKFIATLWLLRNDSVGNSSMEISTTTLQQIRDYFPEILDAGNSYESVFQSASQLPNVNPIDFQNLFVFELGVYGNLFRNLTENGESDDVNRLVELASEVLVRLSKQIPGNIDGTVKQIWEFRDLYESQAFDELRQRYLSDDEQD